MGYEDPPANIQLDEGVYYNKYMEGKKIKMSNPLSEGIVTCQDGTLASESQMAKDVTTFLTWAAEPTLEQRHKMGVRVIIFLIIFTILIYFSMRRLWSDIDPEK